MTESQLLGALPGYSSRELIAELARNDRTLRRPWHRTDAATPNQAQVNHGRTNLVTHQRRIAHELRCRQVQWRMAISAGALGPRPQDRLPESQGRR